MLNEEKLEQVNTNSFFTLNDFMTSYEQSDFNRTIEIGTNLLNDPNLSQMQKEEVARLMDNAKQVLANSKAEGSNTLGM